LYNRGLVYRKMKRYDDAIADLTGYLKLHPKDPDTLFYRGLSYADGGDYNAALTDLNAYVRLAPNDPDGYYNRGRFRAKLGDSKGAIADLQLAAKLYRANNDATSANDADDLIRTLQSGGQILSRA